MCPTCTFTCWAAGRWPGLPADDPGPEQRKGPCTVRWPEACPKTHPTYSCCARISGDPGCSSQFCRCKLKPWALGAVFSFVRQTPSRGSRVLTPNFLAALGSSGTPGGLLRLVCAKQGWPSERRKARKIDGSLFCGSPFSCVLPERAPARAGTWRVLFCAGGRGKSRGTFPFFGGAENR